LTAKIEDILQIADDTTFAIALGDLLYQGPPGEFADLRPAEQVVWCIDGLEREVNNGGFEQFFLNSAGDQARETVSALRTIGAHHTAGLVERANGVFAGGPSPNRDVRQGQVEALGETQREIFNQLDQEFFRYEDKLTTLLRAYVAQHTSDFS